MVHLYRTKVCVVGRSFIKRGVRPLGIVEPDPVVDDAFGFEAVLQFVQINGLLLEGSPQALDEDIVEVSPPTIYYRQLGTSIYRSNFIGQTILLLSGSVGPQFGSSSLNFHC